MKRSFERDLPENYAAVMTVDAKSVKFGILMNLVALVIAVAVIIPVVLVCRPTDFFGNYRLSRNLIFLVAIVAYIVLHELVHGIAYKLLTGQKLTFGITLTVAYCGVPDIYVYRRTAMIALLAPFVLFSVVFALPFFLLHDPWDLTYAAFLLGLHLGGCSGDLYDTVLYLFRFRDPRTLMQDTGPKQTFYLPKD
ncbi:MAG: DUF3267 domain-containing protein [Eubacteriales bacterium]